MLDQHSMHGVPQRGRGPKDPADARTENGRIQEIAPAASTLSETGRPLGLRLSARLDRRTFLRGTGTAMALPWLDAMLPKAVRTAEAGNPPVRMAFLFVPNGVNGEAWTPIGSGANYQLSSTLEPLDPFKSEVLVFTGLSQRNAKPLGDGGGDHARSAATFLTGHHPFKTAGANIRAAVSVDQFAAAKIGMRTPLPSLELGIDPGAIAGDCDTGYSCAYSSNISWKTPFMPMAREVNPKLVFERMFGAKGFDPQQRAQRDYLRQSILDTVQDDAARLRKRLGTGDRQKIDEYFTGVRDLELRIEMDSRQPVQKPPGAKAPPGIPADFEAHVNAMFDIMTLAFQVDVTRIATFMLANEASNRAYTLVGAKDGHHALSHHGHKPEILAQLAAIDRYLVSQYVRFLKRLQAIKEGEKSLLNNCLILYGAGIADGNHHTHVNLPILLAGRGGGTVTPGRHLVFSSHTPLNNLFLSMLDRVGAPAVQFGDSTGRLPGI